MPRLRFRDLRLIDLSAFSSDEAELAAAVLVQGHGHTGEQSRGTADLERHWSGAVGHADNRDTRLIGNGLVDLVPSEDHRDVVLDGVVLADQITGSRVLVVADDELRIRTMKSSLKRRSRVGCRRHLRP